MPRLLVVTSNGRTTTPPPTATALYRRQRFVLSGHPGELLPDGVTREQVMEKALA
ncbi:MAG TPA: hypothetical protein VFG87_28175 [Amycolatopsis sp.]|nr:hypothetical protein [Amycolatopsis sp.]